MPALASVGTMAEAETAGAAVMLVDDSASKRLAVQAMLSPLGYDVVEADSGRAALSAVLGQHFAVIAGRIVAVADVFDALTHERPYKLLR